MQNLTPNDVQQNLVISPPSGKGNFGGITSLAIDRGLDLCQLHVDIVRYACAFGEKKGYLHYPYG